MIDGAAIMGLISFLLFSILLYAGHLYLQHTGWTQTTSMDDWCGQQQVADSPSHNAAHVNVLNSTCPAPLASRLMFALCMQSCLEQTTGTICHNYRSLEECVCNAMLAYLCVCPYCVVYNHGEMLFICRPTEPESDLNSWWQITVDICLQCSHSSF